MSVTRSGRCSRQGAHVWSMYLCSAVPPEQKQTKSKPVPMTQSEPGVDAELDRLQLLEVQQDELGAQPIAHLLQQRLAVKRALLCPQYVPGCPAKASNGRLSDAANDHHAARGRRRWGLGWYSMHSKWRQTKSPAHAKRPVRCRHVDGTWQVGSADTKRDARRANERDASRGRQ